MKRSKGFTLIELLAVIVILAIIALIATPMVLEYIENSKEKAFYNSVESIKKAAELKMVSLELDENVNYPVAYDVKELNVKNINDFKGKVILYEYEGKSAVILNNITDGTFSYSGTDSKDIIGSSYIYVTSPTFSNRILQYKPLNDTEGTIDMIDEYVIAPCVYYEYYEDYSSSYYSVDLEKGIDIDDTMNKFDEAMKDYIKYVPQYVKEERKILVSKLKEKFGSSITASIDTEIIHSFYDEIKDEIPFCYDVIINNLVSSSSIRYNFDLVRDTNKIVTIIPNKINDNSIKRISKCSAATGATSTDDFSTITGCHDYPNIYNAYYDLIISEGIEEIGKQYFQDSYVLSVVLPSTIKSIEMSAFNGNYIKYLDLPEGLTTLGVAAFKDNQIEGKLVIPGTLSTIPNTAFMNNSIETLIIKEGVKKIVVNSFANNNINTLILPETLISIGAKAFTNNNIEEVTIPATVTSIGTGAFLNNPISKVTIEGDATRFNETWTSIGFPEELMPN